MSTLVCAQHLAFVSSLALVVSACGGGSRAQHVNTNTGRALAPVVIQRTPFRIALVDGGVIALREDGTLTVDDRPIGTLQLDGTITRAEGGTPLAALGPDGRIHFDGAPTALRLVGAELRTDRPGGYSISVDPSGPLVTRDADGNVVEEVPIEGLTAGNSTTVLFAVATAVLEMSRHSDGAGRAERDAQGTEGDESEESDDVVLIRVPIDGAPQRGPADALVTIVVFSDFECPFCWRVLDTLERVLEAYGSDLRLVFRHNPLSFHPNAHLAAEAAMEAFAQRGDQGFWQMHDLLFDNQRELGRASLERYAALVGLDLGRFRAALDGHVHAAAVDRDLALARSVGVSGTPSFFVNGRPLVGAQPFDEFQQLVEIALRDARARVARGVPRSRVYDDILAQAREAPAPPAPERTRPPESPRAEDDPTRRWTIPGGRDAPARGPRTAPVTIEIFSDFQCPFCARAVPVVERIVDTYRDRVRIVFRHLPLPFHAWAHDAAELAVEVRRQRGDASFWQYHDLVFENQRLVNEAPNARDALIELAGRVPGVDLRAARRALERGTHRAAVDAEVRAVEQAGLPVGTPTFLVNGRLLRGAQPYETFESLIEEELRARP